MSDENNKQAIIVSKSRRIICLKKKSCEYID